MNKKRIDWEKAMEDARDIAEEFVSDDEMPDREDKGYEAA